MSAPRSPEAAAPPLRRRREGWGIGLIFAAIVWFYAYIGIPPQYAVRFLTQDGDYYNQLTDGFLSGRLGFRIDPPPSLTSLADPYDPVARQRTGAVELHDATYYKGRYYLYFGVAPVLVLFLPFKALTGIYFPQNLGTVLFCAGGYLCSLGLLLGLRRRFFPRVATAWIWLGAVMLGLGNFCAPMLARNGVWEVPISSAYFFSCLGFWLLWQATAAAARRRWLLAAAGLAFGLATASRPHFVFLGLVLAGWALAELRRRWRRDGRGVLPEWTGRAAAFFVPFAIIVAGLLAYNYLRFDNPFEFGQKYQLSGNTQLHAKLIGLRFFPVNLYYDFLAPAQLERYFPFVQVIRGYPGVRPADYGGAEDPYGVFGSMPFSWLALLAPLLWFAAYRRDRELGGWLARFGTCFAALAGATLCFAWSANRYEVDFIPLLLLVATLGLLMAADLARRSAFARGGAVAAAFLLIGSTAAFNVLAAFRHNDLFKAYRPATFAALSRWFDRPALAWERRHPQPYGPIELTVRFPRDQIGKAEPLLVSGVSYQSDFVYVLCYPNLREVRLAFTHTNGRAVLSQPIPVDFAVPHRIGIAVGSLYPAASHPYFSGWKPDEVAAAKRTVRVTLDGIPYLAADGDVYDASPGFVVIGENRVSDYIGPKFTGELLAVGHPPLAPAIAPFAGGAFLRLAADLPRGAAGRREPLVATGAAGGNDLLFVDYVGDDAVRFGLRHSGSDEVLSPAFAIHPGEIQLIDASLGSFYPQPRDAREAELAKLVVVRLNGRTVWVSAQPFHPSGGAAPVIGGNPFAVPGCAGAFTASVAARQAVRPFAAAPRSAFVVPDYWLEADGGADYGAMRLRVELARQPPPRAEPLVVTGASAILADYVTITDAPAGEVSLGYVHAGGAGPQSRRVPVDPSRQQVIEIEMPSLYPSESDPYFSWRSLPEIEALRRSHARLELNGRVLFDTPVAAFDAAAADVSIGTDPLAHAFGPRFSGRVVSVERACARPPSGLDDSRGPLELAFTFPPAPIPSREVLLATGGDGPTDSLQVSYDSGGRAVFEVRLAQGRVLRGKAVPLDGVRHVLRVSWGGLSPAEPAPQPAAIGRGPVQGAVRVTLDGATLIDDTAEFVHADPQRLILGGAVDGGGPFTGRLHSVRRLP